MIEVHTEKRGENLITVLPTGKKLKITCTIDAHLLSSEIKSQISQFCKVHF